MRTSPRRSPTDATSPGWRSRGRRPGRSSGARVSSCASCYRDPEERLLRGPQGLVVNVFTERAWRRGGVAAALMRELLRWCQSHGIESLVLHASDEGRPLYERIGFKHTNEMRYEGERGGGPGEG